MEREARLEDTPPGSSLSGEAVVAAEAGRVHAVWFDTRDGLGDIYHSVSVDEGRTWSDDDRLDGGLPGAASSRRPALACSGDRVYAAWEDDRNGLRDVYLNVSLDGGVTWRAEAVRLDTDLPGAADSYDVQLDARGDAVVAVWADARGGLDQVRVQVSTDAGATWLAADVRVDTSLVGTQTPPVPRICATAGGVVHVVWEDARTGITVVRYNRSVDGGATWGVADRRLDTALVTAGAFAPRVCCDGAFVYAVWTDARSGLEQIRVNASTDHGATWLVDDRRLDDDAIFDGLSSHPDVACVGSAVHVVWQDDRTGTVDIRYRRSVDAGLTWGEDVRIDTDPTASATSLRPVVCADGAYVFAAWHDDRLGVPGIRLNASSDAGATWAPDDWRVDEIALPTPTVSFPALACEGGAVYVVWADARFGAADVFANGGVLP